ncbi:MAG: nicotinate-nicotinamide nucleotide adenylyltransferase, partial [Clostridiales bacterium]|nr:nicotinate-nicotinamide nucleotide adenylyltransferase [Clostridiales bacterium]
YTYDTLLELRKIYPDSEFFLILGQDQFLNFDKWYNYKKISQVAVLCTAAREKDSRKKLLDFASGKLKISNCYIADFEPVVVSSSEIREKIKNNIDISGLVPNAVKDYIINKEIYVEKF